MNLECIMSTRISTGYRYFFKARSSDYTKLDLKKFFFWTTAMYQLTKTFYLINTLEYLMKSY